MYFSQTTVIAFCVVIAAVAAWPSGAPDSSCNSFRPWHTDTSGQPYKAQNENHAGGDNRSCPYQLTTSSDFAPGQPITSKYNLRREVSRYVSGTSDFLRSDEVIFSTLFVYCLAKCD